MISAKKRFDILKRDWFKCQYCGRTWKDVTLEVDHIISKALGGTDDVNNLITCCRECNLGKGKRSLNEKDLWKSKIKDEENKVKKWFYKKWNENNLGEINSKNLYLINYILKHKFDFDKYKQFLDFCRHDYKDWDKIKDKYNYIYILDEEFLKWEEFCDNVLLLLGEDSWSSILDLFDTLLNDGVWFWKAKNDLNIRLNYLLSSRIWDLDLWDNYWVKKNSLFHNLLINHD